MRLCLGHGEPHGHGPEVSAVGLAAWCSSRSCMSSPLGHEVARVGLAKLVPVEGREHLVEQLGGVV